MDARQSRSVWTARVFSSAFVPRCTGTNPTSAVGNGPEALSFPDTIPQTVTGSAAEDERPSPLALRDDAEKNRQGNQSPRRRCDIFVARETHLPKAPFRSSIFPMSLLRSL